MPDYKEMYNKLCRAQAKLDYLFEEARDIIGKAQEETEQLYMDAKEPVFLLPVTPAVSPQAEP